MLIIFSGVHRGLLLSLSPGQKNNICEDFFHAQLYAATNPNSQENFDESQPKLTITDDPNNESTPQHPLFVGISTDSDVSFPAEEKNIFFKCAGKNFRVRVPIDKVYLISFSFRSGWFYISTLDDKEKDKLELHYYMSLSSKYVSLTNETLELKYLTIRETLGKSYQHQAYLIDMYRNTLKLGTKDTHVYLKSNIILILHFHFTQYDFVIS